MGGLPVLTKPGTDRILGVSIVGPHAGEMLAEYVLAMTHSLGLKKIMDTIHVYPTLAEANKFAASAWRRDHHRPIPSSETPRNRIAAVAPKPAQ